MITKLKLKGNELLIFALIHGFSQDGETRFKGSIRYLMMWTGLDKSTIISILKKLVERDYLEKFEHEQNRVKHCEYATRYWDALHRLENPTTPVELDNHPPVGINNHPVVGKSDLIKTTNNNTIIDSDVAPENVFSGSLFPDADVENEEKAKKTLFRNSKIAKLVNGCGGGQPDYTEFEKLFSGAEFERIDLVAYYNSVSDWSDQKNMKRTKNGWTATIRNFIRGDIEKNRVKLKPEFKAEAHKINVPGAMDYLNDNY